jgi:hypothetical protein
MIHVDVVQRAYQTFNAVDTLPALKANKNAKNYWMLLCNVQYHGRKSDEVVLRAINFDALLIKRDATVVL